MKSARATLLRGWGVMKAPLTHLLQIPQVSQLRPVRQVAHDEGKPGRTLRLFRFSVYE
jgi:hypothetical protein